MIKDSGKRIELGGMVRDTDEDKIRYDLVFDGPMFERWAKQLTGGAKKYTARNWMGAYTDKERSRFIESAVRHFVQWLRGDTDEDHAAAVFFNINGAEYIKHKQATAGSGGQGLKIINRPGDDGCPEGLAYCARCGALGVRKTGDLCGDCKTDLQSGSWE